MKTLLILGIGAALGAGATMVVNVYLPQQAEAKPAEVVHPVSWWTNNKPERTAKVEQCRNNPGELAETPNCINAIKADAAATWKGNGKVPSILDAWGNRNGNR